MAANELILSLRKIWEDFAEQNPDEARKGFFVDGDGNIVMAADAMLSANNETLATLAEQRAREAAFIKLAATRANVAHIPSPFGQRGDSVFDASKYIYDEESGVWIGA